MKIENNMTMKMKLNPEISCLETQEKFWRGKLKEISDKYAEEKQNMQQLLFQITAENKELKNELDYLKIESQKRSVSVQTSMNTVTTNTCIYCGTKTLGNKTIPFDQNHGNSAEDSQNMFKIPSITTGITSKENVLEKCTSDVEKTITKLFPSDDQTDFDKIAHKLIELYEKRGKLIPEVEYDERKNILVTENISMAEKDDKIQIDTTEKLDDDDAVPNEEEEDPTLAESALNDDGHVKNAKINKPKIFPTVQNIRKKVIKNFSRIKRTCVDLKANNAKLKSCMSAFNGNVMSSEDQRLRGEVSTNILIHTAEETTLENIPVAPKCQLTSAMKKSKSTGNIVKKVAFLDDLPTSKTVSESNLLEIKDYRLGPTSVNSHLVDSAAHLRHEKIAKPVPAPRSKKNIISNS